MSWVSVQNRYLYLLCALLLFFIISPFIEGQPWSLYLLGLLFTLIFILSVYVIEHSLKFLFLAGTLSALSIVSYWIATFFDHDKLAAILDYGTSIIFFLVMTSYVIRVVYRERRVTASTLYGAICGYLMIGLTWAFIYALLYTIYPQAFSNANDISMGAGFRMLHFIYYSFVTLTTLGYGDVTPLIPPARAFAWLEAIVGQIYLTVWLAQLVALHIVHKGKNDENDA